MKRTMFSNPQRRKERQEQAIERKEARAQRTPEEQLDVLAKRGITSGREFDRLRAVIEGRAAKTEADKRAERRKKYKKVA